MNQQETNRLIDLALDGNAEGLEQLLASVQDMVFNLSLRMLGTVPDAEDAAQDILVRIMTSLSTFRKESSFQTWVYRIATNYLPDSRWILSSMEMISSTPPLTRRSSWWTR